jgi:hypothetical protein
MARKPRDFKAEYARRLAREQERARREGREFSRHRARGHVSREHEATKRKARIARRSSVITPELVEATRGTIPREEWYEAVAETRSEAGDAYTYEQLRRKLEAMQDWTSRGGEAHSPTGLSQKGTDLWNSRGKTYHAGGYDYFLRVEFLYYRDSPN